MKHELDLALDRFFGSDGWERRAEDIDTFDLLSPIERIQFCIAEKMSVYDALDKCRIPFGAMVGFMKVYKELELLNQNQFEVRYRLMYFPHPEEVGLVHHVYYKDCLSGRLITEDEYKLIKGD